ncbi:flavin reductase family protein [Candidatus Fermentibacteria bacterium]|nr:flavin reductase family protein [Candidatus Fermentibacteria bacterium]
MAKIETDYLKYFWPMRHYLVTCGEPGRANIIAVSFCMPVSKEPPMVACAIGTGMHSCELIRESREFVVNVPTEEMARQIYYCGVHSGRDVDKFKETGSTPMPARRVKAPIIGECVAHVECRVVHGLVTGDKTLWVAEVVDAYADADVEEARRTVRFAGGKFPHTVYGSQR